MMYLKQHTLKHFCSFKGKGLHTGREISMKVNPAPIDFGIVFKRLDLDGEPLVPANTDFLLQSDRCSALGGDSGAQIYTVEHLLAALFTSGIDNAFIELNGPEIPILDGSSMPFVEAFNNAGIEEQDADRVIYEIKKKIHFKDKKSGSEITVLPDDSFSAEVMIDFNSKVLGLQYARFTDETDFATEIAPCRTFVFFHELEPLFKNNLIKGGDIENAIVIVENEISQNELDQYAAMLNLPRLEKQTSGYLNHLTLRFQNECARHKLLDVIGDFALVGFPFKGKIIANKPGHKINTTVAKLVREAIKEQIEGTVPQYDPDAQPRIDIAGIKKLLPHRPPFLMVDRISSISKNEVVGIKNIGINEGFFIGHFPEEPVMPGVLIIEAMAQVGGILVLSDLDEPERYSTYFAKIDNVRFKKKVVPGDVLVIKLVITSPLRRSIVCMSGKVFVGNTLVCEGDMMAQVIKNK